MLVSIRLDTRLARHVCVSYIYIFLLRSAFHCFSVDPMHYLQDPQISFFNKTFIKNGSHDTIHAFKNYFATIFSVFSKISGIQINP